MKFPTRLIVLMTFTALGGAGMVWEEFRFQKERLRKEEAAAAVTSHRYPLR